MSGEGMTVDLRTRFVIFPGAVPVQTAHDAALLNGDKEAVWGDGIRLDWSGVNPNDQTAHQAQNMVDGYQSIPKEKTDERKSSQQRIQMNCGTAARQGRKAPGSDLSRA
jgi:hypothetical protein